TNGRSRKARAVNALDFRRAQAAVPKGHVVNATRRARAENISGGIQIRADGKPRKGRRVIDRAKIIDGTDQLAIPINAKRDTIRAHREMMPVEWIAIDLT